MVERPPDPGVVINHVYDTLAPVGRCGPFNVALITKKPRHAKAERTELSEIRRRAINSSFPSPNGAYNAVLLRYSGGASIASYCYDKVLVLPNSVDEQQAVLTPNRYRSAESKYEVYSAQCDTFRDHSNSPKLRWTADYALEIMFSINSTALVTRDVRLKKLDDSKQVNVRYVVENDPNPNQ